MFLTKLPIGSHANVIHFLLRAEILLLHFDEGHKKRARRNIERCKQQYNDRLYPGANEEIGSLLVRLELTAVYVMRRVGNYRGDQAFIWTQKEFEKLDLGMTESQLKNVSELTVLVSDCLKGESNTKDLHERLSEEEE